MSSKFKNCNSIGCRIEERRKALNLTRNVVCEELGGIALSTLQLWEQGAREPNATKIIELANILKTSTNYLLHGEGNPVASQADSYLMPANDDAFEDIEDCREVRISAGGGGINSGHEELTTTKVERAWLQARRLKAKDCAMFLVSGESMYPTLKDGEEIIVDRSKRELSEGKIFVLNHNGSMLVKKVQFTYNGVELISDNPAYRPLKLDAEEANNLVIIGQVVRGYRDF
ncbi:XRE family transcriptional regulator [uncultured Haemophilus sp.]|uniref:XRE family transcriptional regulator n=1 Tax=uncultured Haemophilus sp. TaxID=237779 RepID=UPI0028047C23|nr:XRE family transcriptional regulator [uncultured Haemophilus sp.]